MSKLNLDQLENLKRLWTDQLIVVINDQAELQRFSGRVGRVVTVNGSGKAIVDFADGAWYDLPIGPEFITILGPDDPRRPQYDGNRNSAQTHPTRQA